MIQHTVTDARLQAGADAWALAWPEAERLLAQRRAFAAYGHMLAAAPEKLSAKQCVRLGDLALKAGAFAAAEQWLAGVDGPDAQWLRWLLAHHVQPPELWPTADALPQIVLPPELCAQVWCYAGIRAWLAGDGVTLSNAEDGLRAALEAYQTLGQGGQAAAFAGFWRLFGALRDEVGLARPEVLAPCPTLWMLGDSHGLSVHGQVLTAGRWAGHRLVCRLVQGLQLWHLAQPELNRYQAQVEHWLGQLPPDAPVVLVAGEIDVRPGDGLWRHTAAEGQTALALAQQVWPAALAWLQGVQARAGRTTPLQVCALPSPAPSRLARLAPDAVAQLGEIQALWVAEAQACGVACAPLVVEKDDFLRDQVHWRPQVWQRVLGYV
jgi:hypothetical protein